MGLRKRKKKKEHPTREILSQHTRDSSSFNMPNFPCADTLEQMSLKKHLMYKHNLSNTAGMN